MPMVDGAGVPLAYEEWGRGPAVLLVHGIGTGRLGWGPALADGARAISYDRRGYGASGAPDPYSRTTVSEQAEDAAALLAALDAMPAVACGADLGALVVLDLLLRHPQAVRAAVFVDVPAFPLVAEATAALAAEREVLETALRDEGPQQAMVAWAALRGAADPATGVPAHVFFADYGAQATLALSRRELRTIEAPVAILDGPAAPEHVRAAGDALAAVLPRARRGGAEDPVAAVRALL
jgi:pimeloyl-ACP methyl ester carboxylesterase